MKTHLSSHTATSSPFMEQSGALQNEFGRRVAAQLNHANQALPHDISERLRAAREQALSKRKVQPLQAHSPRHPVLQASHASGRLSPSVRHLVPEVFGFWSRLASAIPLVALVAGLWAISAAQGEFQAQELAEVDAALLTDDLPPAAYTDPGFVQYMKMQGSEEI